MSKTGTDLEDLLAQAADQEREYNWGEAAALYDSASRVSTCQDSLSAGRFREARARALFHYSFQAEDRGDFLNRLEITRNELLEAKNALDKPDNVISLPMSRRCDALIAYIHYWLSDSVDEKKELIAKSWNLAKKSMDEFEAVGEGKEFARTFDLFSFLVQVGYHQSGEFAERDRLVREALAYSEKAAGYVDDSFGRDEAARHFMNVNSFTGALKTSHTGLNDRSELSRISAEWWYKSFRYSREAALSRFGAVQFGGTIPLDVSEEELTKIDDELLRLVEKIRDRLLSGLVYDYLCFRVIMFAHNVEDADEVESLLEKALDYANRSSKNLAIVSFTPPVVGPMWPPIPEGGYWMWKAIFAHDPDQKKRFAEAGLEVWPEYSRIASESEYPYNAGVVYWDAVRLLNILASAEQDNTERRKALEKSIDYVDRFLKWGTSFYPHDPIQDGIKSLLADTEYQLYEVTVDTDERVRRLRSAIKHKQENLEAFAEAKTAFQSYYMVEDTILGSDMYLCGKWSMLLYELTSDRSDISDAIRALGKSVSHFHQLGWPSRCAESRWQEAMAHDLLGDYEKAAWAFTNASEYYGDASEKLPRLKEFFQQYELYMRAWSKVETAKHYHLRQEPKAAKEHFEAAGAIFAGTRKWAHLAGDMSAWARLENAESLSRTDLVEEASAEFVEATKEFESSITTLQSSSCSMDDQGERRMIESLVTASGARAAYCTARVLLENAKMLDRRGDEAGSSEKYGAAVRAFQQIHQTLAGERDRKDIELIITLAKAWQAMTKAEAEVSADMYSEAADLFEEARTFAISEKEKLMMAGHGRFCKALDMGTQFADVGDESMYSTAVQHLNSAAKYYLKAGNENASEYANASKLLLDAYLYMNKAGRESNPEKTAKFYAMSEKLLGVSASSFDKAGYPGRREELTRLLAKVKRDRELAVSLSETLRAPEIVSATSGISSPVPTLEKATGLDGFEYANIQATLIARPKTLLVGESMHLEIELVNAGRTPAKLTKVEQIAPEGFEVVEKPQSYRLEDSYLNLRGRRLDALKTEDVKLILKPAAHGRFTLRPRIMYLDDSGKYKSHEPEPVEVTVKELGISGWLRGADAGR